MTKSRKILFFISFLLVICTGAQVLLLECFPKKICLIQNEEYNMALYWPFSIGIRTSGSNELLINGNKITDEFKRFSINKPLSLISQNQGKSSLELQILRLLPLKEVVIDVRPQVHVYPGGEAIGVLLQSKGVQVVEVSYVVDDENRRIYPAREAGIEKGDIVMSINGETIENKLDMARIVRDCQGAELHFEIQKAGNKDKRMTAIVKPCRSSTGIYMVGLYINDGVAGVGTLTFFEPETLFYGALGHIITDSYTKYPVDVGSGRIVNAAISGVSKGEKGMPGEKYGSFFESDQVIGNITQNTRFGIFGILDRPLYKKQHKEPIPVASVLEVKCGPAFIYTVIKGNEVERFDIEIEKVYRQNKPADKGMIIRAVDERLLAATGGIIQGMSGSPIIQEGKLVGAITHVFINDPTRGYGIMAEWMVREAYDKELLQKRKIS